MAHLNLRDRVIEATIAYVGGGQDDLATNFAHVTRDAQRGRAGAIEATDVDGGRRLSLDWRPRDGARLNDCELTVKLVSSSGAVDEASMERVLVDADGMVLVLEADPEAEERNRRAVEAVRGALARAPDKKVPVVVQMNRRDGDEAARVTIEALPDDGWPRVAACAAKGDGVMETLQRAVDGVVQSMQKQAAPEPQLPKVPGIKAEGNPLLAALRQILQAAVSEQMGLLETRLGARFEAFEARVERVESAVLEANERAAAEQEAAVARADALTAWMERLESTVIEAGARAAGAQSAMRADLERLRPEIDRLKPDIAAVKESTANELKELRKVMRDEATRAASGSTITLQKAIDALASEVKKVAASDHGGPVAAALERLGGKSDGLRGDVEALVGETQTMTTKLGELATLWERGDVRASGRSAEVADLVKEAMARVEARAEAAQTALAGLHEEMTKRKKSWFG